MQWHKVCSRSETAKLKLKDRRLELSLKQQIFYAKVLLPRSVNAKDALQTASDYIACTPAHRFRLTELRTVGNPRHSSSVALAGAKGTLLAWSALNTTDHN